MTIAAAWVRTHDSGAEELYFCSDSRLAGGKRFDHCQKIFRFARTDAAICFAGGSDWAYPMIVAAINSADLHVPSQTRALSLGKFKAHVINILNEMQKAVHNFVEGENIPDVTFLLGGYDWWSKCFRIWRVQFNEKEKRFRAHERKSSGGFGTLGKIEIAGDAAWTATLRKDLKALAQQRYGKDMRQPPDARFNLEPFEIIRDLLRNAKPNDSIGGAPQAVKVYQFLNSADVGIMWPQLGGGRLCVSGRPLLEYEHATLKSILDPDALVSTWCSGSSDEAVVSLQSALAAGQADEEGPDVPN